MTCLSADALATDVEGLAFLKSVLESTSDARPLPGAFDPAVTRPGWSIVTFEGEASMSHATLSAAEAA